MKCREWQDIILTDYLDDQMNKEQVVQLEEHLSSCQECREFSANARKAVIEPFEHVQKGEPSENVWHNIKEAISENQDEREYVHLWDRIKELVFIPRPAMAFTTIAILFLSVTLVLNNRNQQLQIVKSVLMQSQMDDVSYAFDELAYFSEENGLYEETDIEEYFL